MQTQIERKTKYNPVPTETKQEIIRDALARITDGHTLAQIASDHGVSKQALNGWLTALGDDYKQLREAYIDAMLAESMMAIDDATDQLSLARAREQFRSRSWMAERRDRSRYGQSQTIDVRQTVTVDVRSMLDARLAKLDAAIAGQCSRVPNDTALPDPGEQE